MKQSDLNARPTIRQGGFTLIELLVVIAIIAILATMMGYVYFTGYPAHNDVTQFGSHFPNNGALRRRQS